MPSLSASIPATSLKVMRKPAVRKPPVGGAVAPGATGAAGASQGTAGQAPAGPVPTRKPVAMPGGPVFSPMGVVDPLTGKGQVRRFPAGGGPIGRGFQRDFRPGGGGGVGGGGIQDAIQSLRGQLGGPTVDPSGGSVSGGGDASVSSSAPAASGEPPWMQLQKMGVGGQGSPQANRAKLAELLAARNGGGVSGGNAGTGPGGAGSGMEPGAGVPSAPTNAPGLPSLPGGVQGTAVQPPSAPGFPLPPPPNARPTPGQIPDETGGQPQIATNPYMDILRQRIGGYGAGPAAQYAY